MSLSCVSKPSINCVLTKKIKYLDGEKGGVLINLFFEPLFKNGSLGWLFYSSLLTMQLIDSMVEQ